MGITFYFFFFRKSEHLDFFSLSPPPSLPSFYSYIDGCQQKKKDI